MNSWLRHPVRAGLAIGLILGYASALIASGADFEPGQTKLGIGLLAGVFFAMLSTALLYMARPICAQPVWRAWLQMLWLLTGIWFAGIMLWGAHSDWNAIQRYAREGRQTLGRVTGSAWYDHRKLEVGYQVAGTTYHRQVYGPKNSRDLVPGSPVTVYYYASAPDAGFCVRKPWQPATLLSVWFMVTGVLPLAGVFYAGVGLRPLWRAIRAGFHRHPRAT